MFNQATSEDPKQDFVELWTVLSLSVSLTGHKFEIPGPHRIGEIPDPVATSRTVSTLPTGALSAGKPLPCTGEHSRTSPACKAARVSVRGGGCKGG